MTALRSAHPTVPSLPSVRFLFYQLQLEFYFRSLQQNGDHGFRYQYQYAFMPTLMHLNPASVCQKAIYSFLAIKRGKFDYAILGKVDVAA